MTSGAPSRRPQSPESDNVVDMSTSANTRDGRRQTGMSTSTDRLEVEERVLGDSGIWLVHDANSIHRLDHISRIPREPADATDPPAGRALRVTEVSSPRDIGMDMAGAIGHLTIVVPLPTTVPEQLDLRWGNSLEETGFVFNWGQHHSLVGDVGIVDGWEWLIVSELESGAYAQVCGSSTTGLAVEVGMDGDGDQVTLVVREGAEDWPRTNIGEFGWQFQAAAPELHDLDTAAALSRAWFETHNVPSGFTRRPSFYRTRHRLANRL